MSNTKTYIAIMAGGVGSRFWPYSRETRPKQFLDILGMGKSLIRLTFERFLTMVPPEQILILTNDKYADLVAEHLPELPLENIICEPSRNNTAPCIAYTALKLAQKDPEATMVVAPSDHVILKEVAFINHIKEAVAFTESNQALVTLGIQPTRPDTGYGYIKMQDIDGDVRKVDRFTEKPDLATAKTFVESGQYLWNAGIFIWKVKDIIESFSKHCSQVTEVLSTDLTKYNTPDEKDYIAEYYPQTDKISIDYAILEPSDNVYTIPADIGWSDLGTWASLHAYREKNDDDNVINADATLLTDVSNSLIQLPKGKLAVIKGLDDYFVIDDGDVLLIYPKSDEQEIKQVRKSISDETYL